MAHRGLTHDSWRHLAALTPARIALGRAGGSLPTRAWLEFSLAHARAQDAVQAPFDAQGLANDLQRLGLPVLLLESAAPDRATYLARPDLGRRLSPASRAALAAALPAQLPPGCAAQGGAQTETRRCDLSIAVSDGLSATAARLQAGPLLEHLVPKLSAAGWSIAPMVVVRFGRVALQDEIGLVQGALLSLMLLGERPGLNAADSLGAYLIYLPRPGATDAQRNCVSNIRPAGLTHEAAAITLYHLLTEARRRRVSGVPLKDTSRPLAAPQERPRLNGS